MTASPFTPAATPVPVTIVGPGGSAPDDPKATRIRLEPALHDHVPGDECVACASRSDIRAILFDLLQSSRQSGEALTQVVIDASALANPQEIADRLIPGKLPALGLRDHTVARSFRLVGIV